MSSSAAPVGHFPPLGRLKQPLARAVLGDGDARQRKRVGNTVLAGAVYALSAIGEVVCVRLGLTDAVEVGWLVAGMAVGPLLFYLLLRSGASRSFADPGVVAPQVAYAIVALTAAYLVNGPVRGLSLPLLGLLPFFALNAISPRIAWRLTSVTLVMIGGAMLWGATSQPQRFDPRIEALHFITAFVCLPVIWMTLSRFGVLHSRLRERKQALEAALARIRELSTRDELTGLINRRHMNELLQEEALRRDRLGTPFCVCLIDLDHFKRINDRHGHATGDAALRRFADIATAGSTGAALLARWGGEEFLLLLPQTSIAVAAARVERLRHAVNEATQWRDRPELQISFSAGLAADGDAPVQRILDAADSALYRAKADGRNRIVIAGPPAA